MLTKFTSKTTILEQMKYLNTIKIHEVYFDKKNILLFIVELQTVDQATIAKIFFFHKTSQ